MKPLTAVKIGSVAAAAALAISMVFLVLAIVVKPNEIGERQREELAQSVNIQRWENPPAEPSIEQTKRLLLICANIRNDLAQDAEAQTRFLRRWQAEIERNGIEAARRTALACNDEPGSVDPSPPIVRPMVRTPTPQS